MILNLVHTTAVVSSIYNYTCYSNVHVARTATTSGSVGPSAWDTVPTHTHIHITGPGWSMVYTTADPGSACPRAESPKFPYFLIFHQPKGCFPPDRQKVLKFTL